MIAQYFVIGERKKRMSCSLKACRNPSLNSESDEIVEVKTVWPKKKVDTTHFHVSWASNGEASFHKSCWDQIFLATRTRKSVKTEMLKVSPQEKTLIKEAKKTAEFKYSYRKIRQEAKRVSDMIKSSSHCVAFTGNCICSN